MRVMTIFFYSFSILGALVFCRVVFFVFNFFGPVSKVLTHSSLFLCPMKICLCGLLLLLLPAMKTSDSQSSCRKPVLPSFRGEFSVY
jgi:hypothetical protein